MIDAGVLGTVDRETDGIAWVCVLVDGNEAVDIKGGWAEEFMV